MEPKDGLALISANGVSIGHGALVAARAAEVADAADVAVAASLEAIRGNPSIVDPAVAAAKPVPGQIAAAARIRALLEGSDRCAPGTSKSVQDALSFRVAPQVHGAYREFARFLAGAIDTELAASDDNPFVSIEERRLISNGNFHPMVLALAADALRPAAGHVGLLSDHRMSHLWVVIWQDPQLETPEGLLASAGGSALLLRYAAAARYTELRALASPVTLDVPVLDIGVEDHATNAPLAVLRTEEALDRVDDLLAVELLMAREAIRSSQHPGSLGKGVGAALAELDGVIEELGERPDSETLHAAVRGALGTRIVPAANAAITVAPA